MICLVSWGRLLEDVKLSTMAGLIASVGRSGNSNDIALVENLVKSYIKKPSCVILLTVACESTALHSCSLFCISYPTL